MEKIHFNFMDRGERQGVFFPVLFGGSEGVKKPEPKDALRQDWRKRVLFRWFFGV